MKNDSSYSNLPTTTPKGTQNPILASSKKRKLILAGGVLAGLLLLGVGAITYSQWYQHPQKIITDSIINALQSDSLKYSGDVALSGDMAANVLVNGAIANGAGIVSAKMTFDVQNKPLTLSADGLIDNKSDLYIKVKDVRKLADTYLAQLPDNSRTIIDGLITSLDNKWVKISANELKTYSKDAGQAKECLTAIANKIQNDRAATREIGDAYRKNQFIVIAEKLGSKDGSLGYSLSADKERAKAFTKAIKQTSIYKELIACDDDFTLNENELFESNNKDSNDARIELWVDRWSHQVTKLRVLNKTENDVKAKTILELKPTFNQLVDVAAPTSFTTLEQLTSDLQKTLQVN